MDIITNNIVLENDVSDEPTLFTHEAEEEDDSEYDFFDDEKLRKPKGKKIKRMRSNFDR